MQNVLHVILPHERKSFKYVTLVHIVSFLNMKRLDAPDIDSFCRSTAMDIYCAIGMDCSDGEWASSRWAHFGLTAAFVGIKDD
jgi:hypothetical protein